jgi:four helix bundle protein
MTAKPRQDLPARALRFSIELLQLQQQTGSSDAMAHVGMQMFRAGSAIGASIEEGQVANSRRDMAAKYAIALREARETVYWLKHLAQFPPLAEEAQRLEKEAAEFVAMLTVSVRKLRERD